MLKDFTEFRETFRISQDRLHRLTLEAHELYLQQMEEARELAEEYLERGLAPEEYEYEPGSARDEYLNGFLQLLMEEED